MKTLKRTQFGNPILRQKARQLTKAELTSSDIKELIANMRYTLKTKKYGVGLAASQVGQAISLAIVEIQPTKTRPNLPKSKQVNMVIINPEIIKTYGNKSQLWEGCISFAEIFAKVPRYKKVRLKYLDEQGRTYQKDFNGLLAHVIQHEVDHLNGVLFVDKVKDSTSYITTSEYKKLIVKSRRKKKE